MRLLLDTHILLWALASPERLPGEVRRLLEDPKNEVLFSAASVWEVAIKAQVGRFSLPIPLEEVVEAALRSGFAELPVRSVHAAGVARLPFLHRDPFDRLLVAQALYEPARLLTADRALAGYSDLVWLISAAGGDGQE
ncbi:Ribonuclease VapC22 [bacterium HR23]|nr:Ribonuclease VapC22 [bacterium HR23]